MPFLTNMFKPALTLTLFLILVSISLYAQEVTVLDADSGIPISNLAIFNRDKSKTTITDSNGKSDLGIFNSNERITFQPPFIQHEDILSDENMSAMSFVSDGQYCDWKSE